MTLADIQNSIYRRTHTNSTTFTNADMLLAINRAYERVNALIRKRVDNYRPTLFTSSDLTTGTASPKFDTLWHDLIALWPSYEFAIENGMASAAGFLQQILMKEKELEEWYGTNNFTVFTITIASPGVITAKNHGLTAGDKVRFITTDALPTGLSTYTDYWVISDGMGDDTFEVSTTKDGTAVNTSGSQSGTHYYSTDKVARLQAAYEDNR